MKIRFTNLYKLIFDKNKYSKSFSLIKNSNFIGGEEVVKFEKNFKKYVNTKYCISVGNGTDALEIAIKSLSLKELEIIVPVNTWISTAEAVITNGYKVVFCDVNLDDYSICLKDLKKKISKKTSAIIPVHLYGVPTDIIAIKKMIKGREIKIIEDCAQAHGAKLGTRKVGSLGDVACFSFFPGKNLGSMGDGGAIVTNSKKVYLYSMRARNHGALKKYDHKFSGRNSRLDTIQAGILNIKLGSYNKCISKRNKLAKIYFSKLKKISEIKLFKLNSNNLNVYHQFVIRTNKRESLKKFLEKKGIQTMIHYPYMLNELKFFKYKKSLINSKNLGSKILSLPISEEHTEKEIEYVANKINDFFN